MVSKDWKVERLKNIFLKKNMGWYTWSPEGPDIYVGCEGPENHKVSLDHKIQFSSLERINHLLYH